MRFERRLRAVILIVAALATVVVSCNTGGASNPNGNPSSGPTGDGTGTPGGGGLTLPASAFQPNTWGYIGCSNTHDTLYGYEHAPGSAGLFWPYVSQYRIEGQVIRDWADPSSTDWMLFDRMKQQFNGGSDPPVVWVQLCENVDATQRDTFGVATYADVEAELSNLKDHSPSSTVFISPLQSYDPPDLCKLMGPGGHAISDMAKLGEQAVKAGLAWPGPGVLGVPNLGPLTPQNAFRDGCHPTGDPHHGPGPGAVFLGSQLADFFDHIPKA